MGKIIGIDLGTTNSCVAVMEGNQRLRPSGHSDKRKPEFAVYESIRRMMPKGPLGDKMLKKLRVYAGPEHHNEAQKPQPLVLK